MTYVHHVEDPGGGEASHEDPDEEAEEDHDGAECLTECTIVQHVNKFCLSPVFGDKKQFDFLLSCCQKLTAN